MIPICEPILGDEELHNVVECIKTGWISSQGKFVTQFEQEFASYIGMRHGVATTSGTSALHLALVALGISKGDEVIVPVLTFVATANVVRYTGATPIFVDATIDNWCIDTAQIEEAITQRTKAIIPVHLYGHPCYMDAIMSLAEKHNLYIIEDVAEAQGAKYKGKKVGSFGDINCFSFFANKIITTGEGGICLTNDKELASKMRILRDHGMNPARRYWHNVIGYNYRMTNLQAAVGLGQLHKADELLIKRAKIAMKYNNRLKGTDITLPPNEDWAEPVMWIYTILTKHKEKIASALKKEGIETRPIFYPVTLFPPYKQQKEYPTANRLSLTGVSLPSSPKLTNNEIEYICEVIRENSISTS